MRLHLPWIRQLNNRMFVVFHMSGKERTIVFLKEIMGDNVNDTRNQLHMSSLPEENAYRQSNVMTP